MPPFQLPTATTADATQRFGEASESERSLNAQAKIQANLLEGANTAISNIIDGLPPPVNIGGKALTKGIYTVLKAPRLPIDIERAKAQLPGKSEEAIDPIKLFALLIAFAIIKAIWCFIKSILHPLPIIGWFFSLCDDDTENGDQRGVIKDANGDLIVDPNQVNLNKQNSSFIEKIQFDKKPDRKQEFATEEFIKPSESKGMSFDEFMSKNYPSTLNTSQNSGGTSDLVPDVQTTGNNSANVQPTTAITYELGNLSSVEARRLFGL